MRATINTFRSNRIRERCPYSETRRCYKYDMFYDT